MVETYNISALLQSHSHVKIFYKRRLLSNIIGVLILRNITRILDNQRNRSNSLVKIYATRVPDVVSCEFWEWCIFQ